MMIYLLATMLDDPVWKFIGGAVTLCGLALTIKLLLRKEIPLETRIHTIEEELEQTMRDSAVLSEKLANIVRKAESLEQKLDGMLQTLSTRIMEQIRLLKELKETL